MIIDSIRTLVASFQCDDGKCYAVTLSGDRMEAHETWREPSEDGSEMVYRERQLSRPEMIVALDALATSIEQSCRIARGE